MTPDRNKTETFHGRVACRALAFFCWSGLAVGSMAQEHSFSRESPLEPRGDITEKSAWSGPDTSDGFDWIELTSGEWLKGDLKALYNKRLEFDSDKLDLLELDWEDVKQVMTERPHMVMSEDKKQYSGAVYIDETNVQVVAPDGTSSVFDRASLLSVVEGAPKEINYWSFKIGAGLTVQRGNTDQADFNLNGRIRRRTAANRFNLDYLGQATVVDNVEAANNHRVGSYFDVFVTRQFFIRPVFAEYFRDRFQNIDHRIMVGAAAGYYLLDTSRTEWDVYGGLAYQYTKFTSVLAGESSEVQTPAFVAGTVYDTELTGWLDLYAKYDLRLVNERSGTYMHHAQAGIEVELTAILDLDASIVWDRTQTPQERDDGSLPEQDDLRFILGVSLDF